MIERKYLCCLCKYKIRPAICDGPDKVGWPIQFSGKGFELHARRDFFGSERHLCESCIRSAAKLLEDLQKQEDRCQTSTSS